MVNFYNDYVSCSHTATIADVAGSVFNWHASTSLDVKDSKLMLSQLSK